MTGGDVLAELKKQSPTRTIVYTGRAGRRDCAAHHRAGGWGFISKSDEPDVLLETISTVSTWARVVSLRVDMEADENDPLSGLTVRERELLGALADGWSNLQIAARIGISRNTVKYHLKNLYDKLNVNNRAMAVALFMAQAGTRDQR